MELRPWILKRIENKKVRGSCSVCKGPIYDNVNPEKIITCAHCVQGLLMMSQGEKLRLRDTLLEKGDQEAARSTESFIIAEAKEEQDDEPSRKFRPAMERKRFMRKARPPYGKNPVRNNRILGQSRT